AAGWLKRKPSRRATTSVPKRPGTAAPAARAPCANSFAARPRPRAWTRLRSSWAIDTCAVGFATVGAVVVGVVPVVGLVVEAGAVVVVPVEDEPEPPAGGAGEASS